MSRTTLRTHMSHALVSPTLVHTPQGWRSSRISKRLLAGTPRVVWPSTLHQTVPVSAKATPTDIVANLCATHDTPRVVVLPDQSPGGDAHTTRPSETVASPDPPTKHPVASLATRARQLLRDLGSSNPVVGGHVVVRITPNAKAQGCCKYGPQPIISGTTVDTHWVSWIGNRVELPKSVCSVLRGRSAPAIEHRVVGALWKGRDASVLGMCGRVAGGTAAANSMHGLGAGEYGVWHR